MNRENGFAYQVLILIIIIIIAIAGVIINKVVGKNGLVDKAVAVEQEYKKEDIVEKINYLVTQKFIELNNQAKGENKSISEVYNANVIIEYLKQNFIIEETYDEEGNFQEGIYLINIDKIIEDEKEVAQMTGKFQLEKRDDKFFVIYYDENDDSQELGELQIQQI